MKQILKLTGVKSAGEPKKKVTRNQHNAILRKKNEADRDTSPKLPISVCINVGADGKLSAIRFSPEAAAKISRAKGFPHHDLSPEEKSDTLRKLLEYDYSSLIQNSTVKQRTHFNQLASSYFPHMWDVRAGGKRTSQELFHDGEKLPWAMGKHNMLRDRSQRELREEKNLPDIFGDYSPPPVLTLSSRRKALRTYSGTQSVSTFSPVAAAALYHHLLPEQGGIVFDPSCGWGGRLLGAIACDKVHKYIGCDPSSETYKGLLRMRDELVPIARSTGRNLEVELHKLGSETEEMRAALPKSGVDAIFSSPPYFGQEEYSDEPTQSYIQFPTPGAWLNGFMRRTLDNCAYALKPGGILAINIADVSDYPGNLKDDFVALAESQGWKLLETLKLALSSMTGNTRYRQCRECQCLTGEKHGIEPVAPSFGGKWKKCAEHSHKYEPIFVFKKK
jgi:hypothetical protein